MYNDIWSAKTWRERCDADSALRNCRLQCKAALPLWTVSLQSNVDTKRTALWVEWGTNMWPDARRVTELFIKMFMKRKNMTKAMRCCRYIEEQSCSVALAVPFKTIMTTLNSPRFRCSGGRYHGSWALQLSISGSQWLCLYISFSTRCFYVVVFWSG